MERILQFWKHFGIPAFYLGGINFYDKVLEALVSSLQFTVFRLAFLESCKPLLWGESLVNSLAPLPVNLVWRNLTPGAEGLWLPELVQLPRAQAEQFQHWWPTSLFTGLALKLRGLQLHERRRRKLAQVFSSVLRTLLRKARKPTHRVGVLENKNQIFQTFDPIAFTTCFFLLRTLGRFFFLWSSSFWGTKKEWEFDCIRNVKCNRKVISKTVADFLH